MSIPAADFGEFTLKRLKLHKEEGMHRTLRTVTVQAVCGALFISLTALPAAAQFAKWPAQEETGALALRVYGSGITVPAMREAALLFGKRRGVIVNITAGLVQAWKKQAIRDADLIFTDSEYMMNSFVQRDRPAVIDTTTTRTLSLHPSSILVRSGNPKGIKGIGDLGKPGLKILVVATPEGGGMWEAVAKSAGGDKLVDALRGNIAFYAANSLEAKSLWLSEPSCDAWLALTPGQTKSPKVITAQEDAIYRSCVIAVTSRSMQRALAEDFADFIESPTGQAIFLKYSGEAR
jgi:accessory colonization factor AcfC